MQTIKTKFKKVTATPKGRIIAFSIFLFFIAIIIGGIGWWNAHKKGIIKSKMETAVREKTNGLYKIKYDDLEMDEVAGDLSIINMNLSYDSNQYEGLVKLGTEPPILLNIYIPQINVSGVETPRALINNEIVGRKLEIKNPVINILYTNSHTDSTRVVPTKEIYEQLLSGLDLIQADTVLISGAQITTSSHRTKKITIQMKDVFITLMNVKVDSSSNADTTRMFFSKEINITCRKLAWLSANDLYNFSADSISINSISRNIHVKSFRVTPTLNEEAFVKALPVQDLRFDLSCSNIQMKNINLPQLFEENIVADSILVGSTNFKMYCDMGVIHKKENRIGFYPHQKIAKIPIPLKVGTIILSDGFFEYKERNKITRKSGKVQFYHVYTSISNFTNDKRTISVNNLMTVDMRSRFMNKTPFNITWLFYLLHPKGRFDLKGSVGPIEGSWLNSFAEPMGDVSIRQGRMSGAKFNFQGDDYNMDGNLEMPYQDLKISMLEKDKGSKVSDKKSLLSFLANVLIKNSNPKKDENIRIAQVQMDRDINYSIFNFSWGIMLKGIKESVGIKQ
jgi:hypothetical protein